MRKIIRLNRSCGFLIKKILDDPNHRPESRSFSVRKQEKKSINKRMSDNYDWKA